MVSAAGTLRKARVTSRYSGGAERVPDREERFNTATTPSESSSRGDPGYPTHLDRYEDAPDLLFVRGRLPQQPGVAIVGTRRCTSYGLAVARAYGQAAAEAGWPVISGLARGIDGEAHRGVVDVGGVVLGCGIDVAYPREHERLGQQILDAGGAIVTEYPPGAPPDGWRFPPRSRQVRRYSYTVASPPPLLEGPPTATVTPFGKLTPTHRTRPSIHPPITRSVGSSPISTGGPPSSDMFAWPTEHGQQKQPRTDPGQSP